jgi:predicted GIY-YIG superfamily endonuclease
MTYSIYVFLDEKNRPYYVGKTNNMVRRKKEHKEAILTGDRLPKYNVARSLMNKGIPFKMKTIRTTTIETEAWKLERYYISKFRRDGYKLMNCTYGGPDEIPMRINNPTKTKQVGINISGTKSIKRRNSIKDKKSVIKSMVKKINNTRRRR